MALVLMALAAIVSAGMYQWTREAVAGARSDAEGAVAAINLEAVLQVTPEYAMMSRRECDSRQYNILSRKARLRVTAAAQKVGREMGYDSVSFSPSSELPDITWRVTETLVTPSFDFCPVAKLTHRPFTRDLILVRA